MRPKRRQDETLSRMRLYYPPTAVHLKFVATPNFSQIESEPGNGAVTLKPVSNHCNGVFSRPVDRHCPHVWIDQLRQQKHRLQTPQSHFPAEFI